MVEHKRGYWIQYASDPPSPAKYVFARNQRQAKRKASNLRALYGGKVSIYKIPPWRRGAMGA